MVLLYVAAGRSAATTLVHIFAGGKSAARPLLDSTLDDEPKYTNYYCWHMVTIIIAAMSACYLASASGVATLEAAVIATLLAFAFAGWSGALIVLAKQNTKTLPQWVLFLAIAHSVCVFR